MKVQIIGNLHPQPGSVGFDVCTSIDCSIPARSRRTIPTGLYLAMPSNLWAGVYSRSGLADRYGLTILNAPGVIDPDYRGEIKLILFNSGEDSVRFPAGSRLAQLIFHPITPIDLQTVAELPPTARGSNGLGSTGV